MKNLVSLFVLTAAVAVLILIPPTAESTEAEVKEVAHCGVFCRIRERRDARQARAGRRGVLFGRGAGLLGRRCG